MEKEEYNKSEGIISNNKDFVQGALFAFNHCIKTIEDEKFNGTNNVMLKLVNKHFDLLLSSIKGTKELVESTQVVPDFSLMENEQMKKLKQYMKESIIKLYEMGDKTRKGEIIQNED